MILKLRKACLGLLLACLFAAVGAAQQTASVQPSGSGEAQANQQKARAVLDRMIQALGGQAYMSLQDYQMEGRSGRFYHGSSGGSTVFYRFWQWPDKERVELTKQRDVVELTLGDQMYEVTFRGSRPIDPKKDPDALLFLARRRHALDIVLRQWLQDPGTALFDEGPDLAENHSVERVTIMTSSNDAVTLSIDTLTHLPVKKTFVFRDPQGYRDEIAEVYDNWKVVQGINTAYNTLVLRNGDLQRQYFITTVTYNNHLSASLFQPGAGFDPHKK
jgi:hypothetical protein